MLARHCEAEGRDPATIRHSAQALLFLSEDQAVLDPVRAMRIERPTIIGNAGRGPGRRRPLPGRRRRRADRARLHVPLRRRAGRHAGPLPRRGAASGRFRSAVDRVAAAPSVLATPRVEGGRVHATLAGGPGPSGKTWPRWPRSGRTWPRCGPCRSWSTRWSPSRRTPGREAGPAGAGVVLGVEVKSCSPHTTQGRCRWPCVPVLAGEGALGALVLGDLVLQGVSRPAARPREPTVDGVGRRSLPV